MLLQFELLVRYKLLQTLNATLVLVSLDVMVVPSKVCRQVLPTSSQGTHKARVKLDHHYTTLHYHYITSFKGTHKARVKILIIIFNTVIP